MPATIQQDALIAQYTAELEERQTFINNILEQAKGRDLDPHETEIVTKASDRMAVLNNMITPLVASAAVSQASRDRMAEITSQLAVSRNPQVQMTMEYRSAGHYILDAWQAQIGVEDARERIGMYYRAAAHQTTADNLGIIPDPIVGSVLNFIDTARPIVSALGVLPVPGGRFTRPKVTQHTDVAKQTAEKQELVSRKMLITPIPVAMDTYGGYVNVSRQNIDFSVPAIMDLVVNDLAGQYAIETEGVAAGVLVAAAVAQTPAITNASDAAAVNKAVWQAAGTSFAATQGQGRLILAVSPDMLGVIGPLFAPVNPQNAISTGFQAGSFGSGPQGNISGITVVMSAGLPAGTVILTNSAAVEAYEQRIGSLSVVEPSVLGVQVAYAGYFTAISILAGATIKLTA